MPDPTSVSVAQNILDALPSFFTLAQSFCWLAGISLAGMSCYSAIKISEGKSRSSWRGVATTLATAIVLLNLPTLLATVGQTLLGSGSAAAPTAENALSYIAGASPLGVDSELSKGMAAAVFYTQFIGWLGAIRGWWMIRSAMNGTSQSTVGAGAIHIIAGVLAANITNFTPYISDLFGL